MAETCQIAARRVRWVMEHGAGGNNIDDAGSKAAAEVAAAAAGGGGSSAAAGASAEAPVENLDENPYESIDPAPAKPRPENTEVPGIQKQLVDQSLPLFERYKAMFSLRNNGSRGAVLALCTGLKDPSPLFRHEVAYVLGQLMHPAAMEALMKRVEDVAEHDMVRHEAAEALGAIGKPECVEFLQKYAADPALMLKESCEVALDVVDYFATTGTSDKSMGGEASPPEGTV